MLVPQPRLIVISALIFIPLAGLPMADPRLTIVAVVIGLVFILSAALDALNVFGSLDEVEATFPEVTRLTKDKEASITIGLKHLDQSKFRPSRVGLLLPPQFESNEETISIEVPKDATQVKLEWPCTSRVRGVYSVENVFLECISRMGYWAHHRQVPAHGEIRVYPNLEKERRHLPALFLNRSGFGTHALRQVGKGREFEQLRDYIAGDCYEDIHWKATARRGHPVSKLFQIERTQEVYLVIDNSRLSAREARDPDGVITTQLERFVNAAMILGLAAQRQGDHFGLITFSDRVDRFVRAKRGPSHFAACRDLLYTLQTDSVSPDFEEICSFIRLRLRRRALLIFLTDLDDPVLAESFTKGVDLIARHHLVLVNMLAPQGVKPLFSTADVSTVDEVYGCLGGHIQWHRLLELKKSLQYHAATMSILEHETACAQLVSQYMERKHRQLL